MAAPDRAQLLRLLFIPLLALALLFSMLDPADAGRLGGGKSFGSRPSYGSGFNRSVPPPSRDSFSQQRQANPGQQAGQQGPRAPGAPAPSRFGGFGGMLGGMLMGGLIGSMLFGGPMGGLGGIGMLEILLLVGGGFLLMRLLRSRRAATASAYGQGSTDYTQYRDVTHEPGHGGSAAGHAGGGWGDLGGGEQRGPGYTMPSGLDEAEFIAGAKALYARLQSSWDRRDLDDIRSFTTSEVYLEIARQAAQSPEKSRTDVLTVEARVLEVRSSGGETVIAVLFDALLREDASQTRAEQVREVWHFSRDEKAARPEWLLEGIQQLA